MRELLPYLALAVSVIACAISAWTAVRAARWRDSDAAQALLQRVDQSESRLDKLEERSRGLASKADIASLKGELKGELHAVCRQLDDQVVPGLNRIEGYFLQLGMDRTK